MTKQQIETLVREAWFGLRSACDRLWEANRWLSEAEDIAVRQEREHRAMGRRFQARYRVSCEMAAHAIIIHHVYEGSHKIKTWTDVANTRRDCALSYAIREQLPAEVVAKLQAAAQIDYAKDIAA